jgi:hypothetical protein
MDILSEDLAEQLFNRALSGPTTAQQNTQMPNHCSKKYSAV